MNFFIIVFASLLVIVGGYAALNARKRTANCNKLKTAAASIGSISAKDVAYSQPLRNYQIKSSYNSCASGNFQNDWVDMCALQNAIQQGCRLLDFEVYDIEGETGVAVSSKSVFTEKGVYNWLPIDQVIQGVSTLAFATATCPNFNDPLFLNFRVKSTHVHVFDDIATALSTYLGPRLLPNKYSYEADGKNITATPLNKFIGKVIVVVDKSNTLVESSKLDEYMNLGGNSVFCRELSYNDVVFTTDMNELIDFNRKNVTICMPNLSTKAANYDSSVAFPFGVQMCAMCFQTDDDNLTAYNELFNSAGHAFIMKPADLLYVPVTVDPLPPLDKSLSYGYTNHASEYYNFNL
jgi:hypothetical protein